MNRIIWLAILSVNVILTTPLFAQQDSLYQNIFELSLDELLNIVVTPSKFPQLVGNVTQKIDVITSKEIATTVTGNLNVCELISKLPGAAIVTLSRNDANWGTYGGVGPKYSTYLLHGLAIDAFVDPMSIDFNAIRNIEVQRGPASVFYPNYLSQDFAGSQSPLAGTINLILKEKIEQKRTIFQSSFGSYNTLNGGMFHQNRSGQLNYFAGSNYEISQYINYGTKDSWLNMQKNPEYKKTKLFGGVTLFLDDVEKQKMTVYAQKTWHSGDRGRVYLGFDHAYGTVNTGYDIVFNDRVNLQSHFGIRSYDRSWQESMFGLIDTLKSNNGVNQFIVPADLSVSLRHGEENILSLGIDFQSATYYTWTDIFMGYRKYGNKSSARQTGIYAQEEWRPLSKLTLRLGLRYSAISNCVELINGEAPMSASVSWSKLLWSVGMKYILNPKFEFYLNAGSSFATPSLKSTGGTISQNVFGIPGFDGQLPNPLLNAESGISIDGGAEFKLPFQTKFSVRGFYTIINDAIIDNVMSKNPSQTKSMNTDYSSSSGGEIEFSQIFTTNLTWYANATYMRTTTKNEFDTDQDNSEIPFSPKIILNLGLTYSSNSGLSISSALNYNGGFYDGTSKQTRAFFKPGAILNTYAGQRIIDHESLNIDVFVQLYNITHNKFEMPWQFKNPGFSGMVGVKVSFL